MAADPVAQYGLKSGSKRRRKNEAPDAFIRRIVKTAGKVLIACDGDYPSCALVYGIELAMFEDIMAANNKTLGKIATKARAVAAARVNKTHEEAEEAKKLLKAEVVQADKRLKRKSWPVDEEQRRNDIHDALAVSLVENDGDIAEASLCLNVPIWEINEMVEGDEVLLNARAEGLKVQATKAESQAFKQAQSGNTQMLKMVLTNLHGDQWSERQSIDVRRVGFAPPADKDAEEVSILKLVKGDNDDA